MFPIKVLVLLSVCNLHFCIVYGVWVLGVLFGDHTVASRSWNLHAVSQAVPHEITTWDHAWVYPLWETHRAKNEVEWQTLSHSGVDAGRGDCCHALTFFYLWWLCCWKEALAQQDRVPGWPCSRAVHRAQDPPEWIGCLQCVSPQQSATLHRGQKSNSCLCQNRFCPFEYFTFGHSLWLCWIQWMRLSDPKVAVRVGFLKLISWILP